MHELFTQEMASVLRNVGTDARCEVHSCVLGIRADKIGWFHLYAPGGLASVPGENEGLLFCDIVSMEGQQFLPSTRHVMLPWMQSCVKFIFVVQRLLKESATVGWKSPLRHKTG